MTGSANPSKIPSTTFATAICDTFFRGMKDNSNTGLGIGVGYWQFGIPFPDDSSGAVVVEQETKEARA